MSRIKTLFPVYFFSLLVGVPYLSAQNRPTIYVGLVSVTPTNVPILSAVDGGYFEKYGLDVKPLVMSGSSTALAAMLSREMSFITIAGSGVINAHLAGRDAVMIAGTVNYAPYELVVAKKHKKIEDLKGHKLGIARFGGSADFLARWGLEKHGLAPAKTWSYYKLAATPNGWPRSLKERFKRRYSNSHSPTAPRKRDCTR